MYYLFLKHFNPNEYDLAVISPGEPGYDKKEICESMAGPGERSLDQFKYIRGIYVSKRRR